MPIRNRSQTVPFNPNVKQKIINAGGTTVFDGGSPNTVTFNKTMTDEITPGYFATKRKAGFLPMNDLDQTTKSFAFSSGSVSFEVKYNGVKQWDQYWSGDLGFTGYRYVNGNTPTPSNKMAVPTMPSSAPLLTEALANARTRGWDVLTFMAEFRKTMELIARFRERTLRRAEKVAKSIPSAKNPVEAFAETWLEGRYGWRLLAYDLEDITTSLNRLKETKPAFIRGYASSTNKTTYSSGSLYSASSYMRYVTPNTLAYDYGRCSLVINQEHSKTCKAGVVLEALIDDIVEINPLVTAWEVIPFSFIIDWFVNVGDVVAAYSPSLTENALGGWTKETTLLSEVVTTIPATVGNPNSGWYYKCSSTVPFVATVTNTTVKRRPATPSASLSFRLNLDDLKLIDLASVFIGRWAKIIGGIKQSTRI